MLAVLLVISSQQASDIIGDLVGDNVHITDIIRSDYRTSFFLVQFL